MSAITNAVEAACAGITLAALGGGIAYRVGRREGKIDQVLAQLTEIVRRHDDDIEQLRGALSIAPLDAAPTIPPSHRRSARNGR